MPYITVTTNQSLSNEICENLKTNLGQAITLLGKTESWLMVNFEPESTLFFQGTAEACALISVDLYGISAPDAYSAFTQSATEIVSNALHLPATRIFVKYNEYRHWGWNGSNF